MRTNRRTKKIPKAPAQPAPKKKRRRRVALTQAARPVQSRLPGRTLTDGQRHYKAALTSLDGRAKALDAKFSRAAW